MQENLCLSNVFFLGGGGIEKGHWREMSYTKTLIY